MESRDATDATPLHHKQWSQISETNAVLLQTGYVHPYGNMYK